VADGATILADNPLDLFEGGQFNDTPILVGTNSNDSLFDLSTKTPAAFEKVVREGYSLAADDILAAYPHATKKEAARAGRDLARELLFAWPTWAWAKLQSRHGKGKAFLYYFDYGPEPGEVKHGAEIPYVLGNFGGLLLGTAETPANRAMSDTIMSYWVNFATSGDPNGPGLPSWKAFDDINMNSMIFGKTPQAGPTPNLEKIKAFDAYYARLRDDRINITGTWKAQVAVGGIAGEPVFIFNQHGDKITGKYNGYLGEYDVTGKITGETIEFEFATGQGKVIYTGKIDQGSMEGETKYGDGLSGTWTAEREPADE
jgi:hypothetical protein